MVLSMNNLLIIKNASIELNSIDTNDVVKVAGILDSIKNFWKKIWDKDYSSRYDKVKDQYSKIEDDINTLREIIGDIDSAINNADIGQYDIGIRRLKKFLFKLNEKINKLYESADEADVSKNPEYARYTKEQWEDPKFRKEYFSTPDPRIKITYPPAGEEEASMAPQVKFNDVDSYKKISKDNIYWMTGATEAASFKILKLFKRFIRGFTVSKFPAAFDSSGRITKETRDAINQAIIDNGMICHFFPKIPTSATSENPEFKKHYMGQYEMGISVEFTLPNTFYVLSAYIWTTDLTRAQHSAQKISIGKLTNIRIIYPNISSTASSNYSKLQKFAENIDLKNTILAVRGIEKTSPEFRSKLINIAEQLGTNPDWLAAVMSNESGFDPSIPNRGNPEHGAVGLIQFMPFTAANLFGMINKNMSKEEVNFLSQEARKRMKSLGAIEQLDYVYKFYSPFKGRLNSPEDVYMAAFWPAGVGKPSDYIIAEKGGDVYKENETFDPKKTGIITKAQVGGSVQNAINMAKGKRITIDGKIIDTSTMLQDKKQEQNQEQEQKDKEQKDEGIDIELFSKDANYGPLENLIRKAIEEQELPKNIFSISSESNNLDKLKLISHDLEKFLGAKTAFVKDIDNNIKINCTAYGHKNALYKAVKSICNNQKIIYYIGD